MTSQSNQPIKIELTIRAGQPELLQGLDLWLRLGLLSDAQVRQICQAHLVCSVQVSEQIAIDNSPPASPSPPLPLSPSPPLPLISRLLSSLMAELSVVWLLFLGVFMVVVSSGVLAATQWQNFSPVGQYSILFGYTLAFWIASLWTRQQQLRLTSRMLQIATLLIIPVNFWTIDGFKLWGSGLGLVLGTIAAFSLCAIAFMLLQSAPRLLLFNTLALALLQLGWALTGFPLIATYIGTVGTAFVLFHSFETEEQEGSGVEIIAIAFSILLLVGRAVLIAGVPLSQLGLALGICGWLLCWLSRHGRLIWTQAGIGLLVLGWLVAVTADPPRQAIAVSCLAIWLLADRLKRLWLVQDLIALFLLGLQAYSLLWRIIPVEGRRNIITLATGLAGKNLQSWELIGLAIFPYILLTLVLALRLRRSSQPILAGYAEGMALTLGIVLALVSLFHPLVRSLYLLVSTLTLAVVLLKRTNPRAWLIYLTHICGLLTLFAWIGWGFPSLNNLTWAVILLICMIAEWSFLVAPNSIWQRSAWHLGLALAALSYVLLLNIKQPNLYWNLIWLVTPAFLTFIASRASFAHPSLASWLSVITLLLAQFLMVGRVTGLLVSLGVATVLMLINTGQLYSLTAAVITVGFGLSFAATGVWQIWGYPTNWLTTDGAIALWGLWLLRGVANNRNTPLSRIYTRALDGWAIAISILNLSILTLQLYPLFLFRVADVGYIILAAILSTAAIAYRLWQQPTNLGFYGIAWGVELVAAAIVGFKGASLTNLAIANSALGLITQLSGDWRGALAKRDEVRGEGESGRVGEGERREIGIITNYQVRAHSCAPLPITNYSFFSSWHVIPLIYAALGLVFAHHSFTATTGLYTLAAALTGIGVGRRQPIKPLIYLSIAGISIAAYELLIYQLLQASGGEQGNGIVELALLATAIAIIYRLLSGWLLSYWRLTRQEVLKIAHLHWAGGSILSLLGLYFSLSRVGSIIWIGVTAILAAYAIWQGRSSDNWIYVGILEATSAIAYLLYRTLPQSILVSWAGAIACLFAYTLYTLHWQTWGWSRQPWQQSAAILPASIVLFTAWGIAIQSLLIVAAFYAWLAKAENRIRISYLSIFLTDWAFVRLLNNWNVSELLWYMTALSGSLLYIAQVDPTLSTLR